MQDVIFSTTAEILRNILSTEITIAKLKYLEDLIAHIKKYPEAKHNAVKVSICFLFNSVCFLYSMSNLKAIDI